MNKENLLNIIKQLKNSSKRKFNQKVDLIINLKDINLKKPEENVDLFIPLPNNPGKQVKICALVSKELKEQANIFDKVISKEEFNDYEDKKVLKKLTKEFDFFVAQANVMTDVAKVFGKTLGPHGKMPNPKSGAVITPTTNLNELREKLQRTARLKTKNEPIIKAIVGNQNMKEEEIVDNIIIIYDALIHSLPQGQANIKDIILKLTMSKPIKLEK
ncbi:MAG: hypothetical protein AABX55_01960 [Nanoarchaeota archaeon]